MEITPTINGREHYVQILKRNGKVLPKCIQFANLEYLWGVSVGKIWCLDEGNFIKKNCVSQPAKPLVVDELKRIAQIKGLFCGDFDRHQPEKEWLLDCLASLAPAHRFFRRDYVASPRR